MNDNGLTTLVRDSVADVHATTPIDQIINRGRGLQRRRRFTTSAGLAFTAVAAGTAVTVALSGAPGASPNHNPGAAPPNQSTGGIRTVGFVLTANANGTLTLTMSQMLDPVALQQALARHGVPALVKTDSYCTSTPAAPDPVEAGVLSTRPAFHPPKVGLVQVPNSASPSGGPGHPPGPPDALGQFAAHTKTVINPAAMPAGTELFVGYHPGDHTVAVWLIYTNSHTCGSQPPPEGPKGH